MEKPSCSLTMSGDLKQYIQQNQQMTWSFGMWNLLLRAALRLSMFPLRNHMLLNLHVFFFWLSILSVWCILSVLTMICHEDFLFWFCLFSVLCVSFICILRSFCNLEAFFSMIWWMSGVCHDLGFFPSSMPVIQRLECFHGVPHFLCVPFLFPSISWLNSGLNS